VVEVDCLDHVVHVSGFELATDEECPEQLAVGQGVATRVPLRAVVRADDDDGGVLMCPRLRVPSCPKRGVERVPVDPCLDG
jgi:hypothetical protein